MDTGVSNKNECLATCVFGHEQPKLCEVAYYDESSQKCYMGNFSTNSDGQFTIATGVSRINMEQGD